MDIFQKFNVSGFCGDGTPFSLFSISVAPPLLLYSYIPAVIISLLISIFVYKQNKNYLTKSFLVFSFSYSLWVLNQLFQWVLIPNILIFRSWQATAVLEMLFYLSALNLFIVFIKEKETSKRIKILFSTLVFLLVILTPSILNIKSYDYENCEGQIGIFWYIIYCFEFLISLIVLFYGFYYSRKKEYYARKKQILLFSLALALLISIFSASNIWGELLQKYSFDLLGPLGIVFFIGFVTYLIVKYQTFNLKIITTQAFVWVLIFLVGSQFFFLKEIEGFILNIITLIGTFFVGNFLIKSVKLGENQVKRLELLRLKLEESNFNRELANDKLKDLDNAKNEFLSLASHQIRSPLTAMKGYSSMLLDGDYGDINSKVKEIIDRIHKSSQSLTKVVDDLLSVSKIEQGGMKYEMIAFDMIILVNEIVDNISINAKQKGLDLNLSYIPSDKYFVIADREKIRQVILNLIDNSIKYTNLGNINIDVKNMDGNVVISVKDTGIGMSEETKNNLFKKFIRGGGSKVNSSGSGIGLYLAKEIIEAHNGYIWAESEGEDKGSVFVVEIKAI